MARDGVAEVMVLRPSASEFAVPFAEFVRKVLRKHPDIPMFKVQPPEGWRPRRRPFPKLDSVEIVTPIKQICYGKGGTYRCILVEQRRMTAARFKEISESDGHTPPESKRGKDLEDTLLERSFWSSVTINPPFYGADTPVSFFDEELPYGWNLRGLEGCLLRKHRVPDIPGVTTPMCYFGMWKSFFSWHKEDADLFSINYLHFGAPKVWYCVPPSQAPKFERMAQSIYPELHRNCHAFMRHKDILMSPHMLRSYGIDYQMCRQAPNEFVVLNAAAYHAGYNTGFNCAEAVNFAMQEWLDVGCAVVRCKCDALKDGVRLSMRLFGRKGSSESESDGDDDTTSDGGSGSSEDEEEASASSEDEGERAGGPRRRSGRAPKPRDLDSVPIGALRVPVSARKRAAAAAGDGGGAKRAKAAAAADEAAAAAAARRRAGKATAEGRAKAVARAAARAGPAAAGAGAKSSGGAPTAAVAASLERGAAAAVVLRAAHEARLARLREGGSDADTESDGEGGDDAPRPVPGAPEPAAAAPPPPARRPARAASAGVSAAAAAAGATELGANRGPLAAPAAPGAPQAIVGEGPGGRRFFYLVQVVPTAKPRRDGRVTMRWLAESAGDGLFRAAPEAWEERAEALVDVRTQWVPAHGGRAAGWRLLTLRSRILETDLVD
ncbi:MAG: JmjC domain, hydroxylase-domain-containing protein [Monoraphidium minutum]|nr:MAG: JmjC domain, hydroxylase-domain-containing protein [Monoraphidium minutum]